MTEGPGAQPTGRQLIDELLQASPDALIVVSEDGVIQSASGAARVMFGYEPVDLVGRPIETLIPSQLRDRHIRHREGYWLAPDVRPMGVGLDLRARREDGTEFPVDVSLVPASMGNRRCVGAFVRDATQRRRDENLLRFVNDISRITIEGWDSGSLLSLVAGRARALVGATIAWVAIRAPKDNEIVVAAADGSGSEMLVDATTPAATSLAARVMDDGRVMSIEDMAAEPLVLSEARAQALGPGIYLPMVAENGPVGALVLARMQGAKSFTAEEVTSAEVFSSAAAIVVALGNARRELEEGRLVSEHERIARDLHDTVIQRLFGLGMRLQATERIASGAVVERIREAVDAIDEVIREIRETIFDLNRPDADRPHLRNQIREVAALAVAHLGFRPRVAFRGPVEAAVDDVVLAHLVAVLREALANVGRHASASRVDIVLTADAAGVVLSVSDDGVGIPDGPGAGHGLVNMASRAEQLGGGLNLAKRQPSGTILTWSVPREPRVQGD